MPETAKATFKNAYIEGQDTPSYMREMNDSYNMGKNGVTLDTSKFNTINQAQAVASYLVGQSEGGFNYGQNNRHGSQRNDGFYSGGQVQGVESNAGQNTAWRESQRFRGNSEEASKYDERQVTAKGLGIKNGTDSNTVTLVNSNEYTKKIDNMAKAVGANVVYFRGGNLSFTDGNARGVKQGNTVYVRLDDIRFTPEQIARHELAHILVSRGQYDVKKVRNRINKMTGGKFDKMAQAYAEAYASEGNEISAEEIWEEIVCDSIANMNIFANASTESSQMEDVITAVKSETKKGNVNGTRGSPDGEVKYARINESHNSEQFGTMWTLEAEILNKKEISRFYSMLSETLNNKYKNYFIANNGDYAYLINNKIIQTDGDFERPVINKVVVFNTNSNDEIQSAKEMYEYGNSKGFEDTVCIKLAECMLGEGNVIETNFEGYRTTKKQENYKGEKRNSKRNIFENDVKKSRALDSDYLKAVETGDMETAQKMVDEAAKEAGYTSDTSWRMDHKAPNAKDDVCITEIDRCYGSDGSIYSKNAAYYYGDGRDYDEKAIEAIRSVKENPEKNITIYRAVPSDIKDTRIRNGDWVTLDKEYAEEHGWRMYDNDYRIIENDVPAKYLFTDGNSIHEFGYDNGNEDEVYKNVANNVKLRAVTYDDNGNVIPLSERFNSKEGDIRFSRVIDEQESIIDLSDDNELTKLIGNKTGSAKYKVIQTYILDRLYGKNVSFSDGTNAIVDKSDAQHIAHGARKEKTSYIAHIEEAIKNAKLKAETNNVVHDKFDYFKYYEAFVRLGKEEYPIYLNVGKSKTDRLYHLYDITEKIRETAHRTNGVGRVNNDLRPANGFSIDNTVPQKDTSVNTYSMQSSEKDVKKSRVIDEKSEAERLKEENDKLKTEIEKMRKHIELSKRPIAYDKDVASVARTLKKEFGTTLKIKDITDIVTICQVI